MSLQKGIGTYYCEGTEVRYWGVEPAAKSIVRIGNYTSIAKYVRFYVDGNHRMDFASTFPFDVINKGCGAPASGWGKGAPVVGNDVWIGTDVTVMSGVRIGDGAVVAANSVVTRDVEPFSIVGGNPARHIKYRFDEPARTKLLELAWWNMPNEFVVSRLAPVQDNIEEWIRRAEEYRATHGST